MRPSAPRIGARHLRQRLHLGGRAELDGLLGHAEHHAALLVLRDGVGAGLAHREHPLGAVGAHPGEQHPYRVAPRVARDALEEDVHRRPLMVHLRAVLDARVVARAGELQHEVLVPGGDERDARHHRVAVARLAHVHRAQAVEAIGEGRGEVLGHVLHDHRARRVGRQRAQHVLDGLRAAGRGADGQHLVRGLEQRPARSTVEGEVVVVGRREGDGAPCRYGRQRRGGGLGGARDARAGGGAHGTRQVADDPLRGERRSRLGDDLHGAQGEGAHRGLAVARRQRADDHHRYREVAHELRQEAQPIHARHLDVERDDVGAQAQDLLAGDVRIDGGADDLDVGVLAELLAEDLPYQRGVVDDQDADHGAGTRTGTGARVAPASGASRWSTSSAHPCSTSSDSA
jgi:hypothetical protein